MNLMIVFLLLTSVVPFSFTQTLNCSSESVPCSPRSSCCPSGTFCNFNVGIPVCEKAQDPVSSGFDYDTACGGNPYLMDCSFTTNIPGFCCPTGTICFTDGLDNKVTCIDAVGTTAAALPSATSVNFRPSATPAPQNSQTLKFHPELAWNLTAGGNCMDTVHSTELMNSSISLNFTGNGILVNYITSPIGGVFSVVFDGVLADTIDTFSTEGIQCGHRQFPPFANPPDGFGSTNEHFLTLIYSGPSDNAPKGGPKSMVQFGSFDIPQFTTSGAFTSTGRMSALYFASLIFLAQIIHIA